MKDINRARKGENKCQSNFGFSFYLNKYTNSHDLSHSVARSPTQQEKKKNVAANLSGRNIYVITLDHTNTVGTHTSYHEYGDFKRKRGVNNMCCFFRCCWRETFTRRSHSLAGCRFIKVVCRSVLVYKINIHDYIKTVSMRNNNHI